MPGWTRANLRPAAHPGGAPVVSDPTSIGRTAIVTTGSNATARLAKVARSWSKSTCERPAAGGGLYRAAGSTAVQS
jgi:hypothetical protein